MGVMANNQAPGALVFRYLSRDMSRDMYTFASVSIRSSRQLPCPACGRLLSPEAVYWLRSLDPYTR